MVVKNKLTCVKSVACTAALALCIAGCGQPANKAEDSASSQNQSESIERIETARDATDPKADGRIDVTTKGSDVATFNGAKYIVSDATASQSTGDKVTEGLGLQEICVVKQPESWKPESIAWDRNSIAYAKMPASWGDASYRYEYINEASGVEGVEQWSQTSVDKYFAGQSNIKEAEISGHKISYIVDEADEGPDLSMVDPDATETGVSPTSGKTISVYAYEQRDEKCAFVCSVTCNLVDDAEKPDAEQLLKDAYAPLEFAQKDDEVDAASYMSDVTITSADAQSSLVLARKGDALAAYKEHSVTLVGNSETDEFAAVTTYDYAPADEAPSDAQELTVGDLMVRAQKNEKTWEFEGESGADYTLVAWTEVGGSPLRVEAAIGGEEDMASALERVLGDRITSVS